MKKPRITFFVSGHGFGHAARSSAVIQQLIAKSDARISIISDAPESFFRQSIPSLFSYYKETVDVGLVQKDPLYEDLPQTLTRLSDFYPLTQESVEYLTAFITAEQPNLIVSDISPLGLAIAHWMDIPSVLLENFTWPWIYEGYEEYRDQLNPFSREIEAWNETANLRIQTQPICEILPGSPVVGPIARPPISSPGQIREQLRVPEGNNLVLITMGGVPSEYSFEKQLHDFPNATFVLPGTYKAISANGNVIKLPHQSKYYHPDLMACADVVIGKLGYSTIAEVVHHQPVFGYIPRPHFRESPPLERYVQTHTTGLQIPYTAFLNGEIKSYVSSLLALAGEAQRSEHVESGLDAAVEEMSKLL